MGDAHGFVQHRVLVVANKYRDNLQNNTIDPLSQPVFSSLAAT